MIEPQSELEKMLVSQYKSGMLAYLRIHPEAFSEAFDLAVSDKQPYAWRASWLLYSALQENGKGLSEAVDRIIASLDTKSGGHQRGLLKILTLAKLNEAQQGLVFDRCVDIWVKIHQQPSVRLIALKMLVSIAEKHPDLMNEVRYLTAGHYLETLTKGAMHSVKKLLKIIPGNHS